MEEDGYSGTLGLLGEEWLRKDSWDIKLRIYTPWWISDLGMGPLVIQASQLVPQYQDLVSARASNSFI